MSPRAQTHSAQLHIRPQPVYGGLLWQPCVPLMAPAHAPQLVYRHGLGGDNLRGDIWRC